MALGQSSLFSAFVFFFSSSLLGGCAFGDVSGTGGTRSGNEPNGGTNTDSTTPSGGGGSDSLPSDSRPSDDGPVDYDALFDAPADPSTTDNLVTGIWAGNGYSGEIRLKVSANKVVIAQKCGDNPAIGMEVGALVTAAKIKLLASKSVGSGTSCSIKVTPVEIPRCSSSSYQCFEVEGTIMRFSEASLFSSVSSYATYTKLSD